MSPTLAFDESNLYAVLASLNAGHTAAEYKAVTHRYQVVIGSITDQTEGVIQDPAGSGIGTGYAPKVAG